MSLAACTTLLSLTGCSTLQQQPPVTEQPVQESVTSSQQPSAPWLDMQQQMTELQSAISNLTQQVTALAQRPAMAPPPPMPVSIRSDNRPVPKAPSLNKIVVGKLEWLWVQPALQSLSAEISTASGKSFLLADSINPYEQDGDRWVAVSLSSSAKNNQPVEMKLRVDRTVRARPPHGGSVESMPVVQLPVRLGDQQLLTDFLLTQQDSSKQSVILGRNFLTDIAVVDVSAQYLQPKYETLRELEKRIPPEPQNGL